MPTRKDPIISPRKLSLIFLFVGVFISSLLFYPISSVFKGNWKLNQKIEFFENVVIDFDAIGIGGAVSSLGLDRQIPIGNIGLRFYSICILMGVLAGYFLCLYLAKYQYIAGTIIDRLIIGLVIFGLIGARLFFVAFNWEVYKDNPISAITEILSGGLAVFGMLIVGTSYIWFYCTRFKFSFFEFIDFLAPSVLLGQIIGRFGNFFNYESYGPATSVYWKMYIPETANYYSDINARYFHPTFLYEIIPAFFLLVIILYYYSNLTEKRSGLVFAMYAIGYGIIRFFTEFFRLDALTFKLPSYLQFNLGVFGKLEYLLVSQISALFLIGFGIFVIIKRRKIIYLKKTMAEVKIS